ncbi:DUF927 domain-containing protein [Citrobacter braakii]|nr:DUF927 domain-containing protein [Citrobacter braakii]
MNNIVTPSPLTTMARFACSKLNGFLARRALHQANAKKILKKAIAISIAVDEISAKGGRDGLPDGFVNSPHGLFYDDGKKVFQLSSTAIVPVSRHYSACKKRNMGVELMTINHAGQYVCAEISLSNVTLNPDSVIGSLTAQGFGIPMTVKTKELLAQFLQACMKQALALPTYLVADSMGFVPGKKAFLHGNMPLAQNIPGFDYLISVQRTPAGIVESGTLDAWKALVKKNVHGWPQIFALCSAFASMLVALCKMDVAMFHFYGGSTTGKTILLQLAMSVHGHGGEPGSGKLVNVLRWNTTVNALEKRLSQFSGLLACVDELGAYKQKDFASLLYNITAGQGKSRMDKNLDIRELYTWEMLILSAGEMSIPEKLATEKEHLQGGQEHRAISLNVLPEDARKDGESSERVRCRADSLKNGLSEVYGTAGKEFIANLLALDNDDDEPQSWDEMCLSIQGAVEEQRDSLVGELQEEGYALSDIQLRALKRFSLCLCAGILAGSWNILPFSEDVIKGAVMSAARRWLDDKPNQYSPLKQVLTAIQHDLLTTRASHLMPLLDEDAHTPYNHWGYTDKNDNMMIFAPVFEGWCAKKGIKPADVAKALAKKNHLKPESQGHYKKRPQKGIQQPFYLVMNTFLGCNIGADF